MIGSKVKRLVSLYDTPLTPLASSSAHQADSTVTDGSSPSHPPPSPARLIVPTDTNEVSALLATSESPTLRAHSTGVETPGEITGDVTDELLGSGKLHFREGSRTARVKNWLLSGGADSFGTVHQSEEQFLLSSMSSTVDDARIESQVSPSGIAVVPHGHNPIPASTVFGSSAAPVSLPRLDNYMSSLPMPPFSSSRSADRWKEVRMFTPMDRLAASGKSIEDLELNSKSAPAWRNRNSVFGAIVSIVLGITGSSALVTFYSIQGLFNTVQLFALVLSTIVPHHGQDISGKWRQLFLGTIPNVLAFNFATTLIQSLIYLSIFMVLAGVLLYCFHRSSSPCTRYNRFEGFQQPEKQGSGWSIVIVSFLLTVIYLPLSTMAVHIIVWSDDLWAVPNPYTNATTNPPIVSPLGPSDQYRAPLDFCYTTTMKRNEINFAPVLVIIAIIIFFGLTIWFPLSLRMAIKQSVPIVDRYTELGKRRSNSDMDREYQRLLSRDKNPLSFLYGGFRRGWGTYESLYLYAKMSTLLIVAIIDTDNCLFRSLSKTTVAVVRQIVLLVLMTAFFGLHAFLAPFIDPVNNASEWVSRLNYILTSAVALAVALNIPGKNIINGPVLYAIYILTYGFTAYFMIINMNVMQRIVKRLARRIDFSIDIFSPRLDISPSSPHARRRIWQESITTLFLTSPECRIPRKQPMHFFQARDSDYPPYLQNFANSPGERHVENLKANNFDAGAVAYHKGVSLISGPDSAWFRHLTDMIQTHFIGPDCYWRNPADHPTPGCTRYFGNAWWIPFPPTLVIKYDDGPLAVLQDVSDLELYVAQNSSPDVQRRHEIRMASTGSRAPWCCRGLRYKAQAVVSYETCVLNIKRKGYLVWEDVQLGSGFDVELTYSKNVRLDGGVIGLNDDYDLTAPLAQFLTMNHEVIAAQLPHLDAVLAAYRQHHKKECQRKEDVLTYRFLTHVYDQPRDPSGLAESSIEFERDLRVRQLMVGSEAVFETAYQRLSAVTTSEAATWWYIFWDDFWRRSHDTIEALKLHAPDFNPHYPTSIAYTPLPRPALETFLTQRGLLRRKPPWGGDFIHHGFLNKIYIRLNDIVFHGSTQAHIFHLGHNVSEELDMHDIDLETQARPSTLGTGGGTDHDDVSIRARPEFRWEGILSDPLPHGLKPRRRFLSKLKAWFGVTPLWSAGAPSQGVALDVRLENGKYVVLELEPGGKGNMYSDTRQTI
ncbi:hypothetical protein EW146_g3878 [Bondarzewia mesenterica]|uniref:Uncharacterized protein n=1 Tax=Bondarzewia mesenterica TaxID=1095465 RepID=A0A4S4LWE5_9AGAM|nr:hypothetical protein EW146_g3878 [Bondarzewia mesenterica]